MPNSPPCVLAAAVSFGLSAGVDFGAGFTSRGLALVTGAGSGSVDVACGFASLASEAATCAGSGLRRRLWLVRQCLDLCLLDGLCVGHGRRLNHLLERFLRGLRDVRRLGLRHGLRCGGDCLGRNCADTVSGSLLAICDGSGFGAGFNSAGGVSTFGSSATGLAGSVAVSPPVLSAFAGEAGPLDRRHDRRFVGRRARRR